MYIDFKRNKTNKTNPYSILQNVKQISKYQYTVHCEDTDVSSIRKILKKNRFIVLHVYPDEMARSSNYRYIFFKTHKRPKNGYRCLYCNRRLSSRYLQVDHIYPVRKAKTKAGQKYLKRHGMHSVNDPKNLAPACSRCNKMKGAKGGIWLIRAKLGSYKWYWFFRNVFMVGLIVALVIMLFIIMK